MHTSRASSFKHDDEKRLCDVVAVCANRNAGYQTLVSPEKLLLMTGFCFQLLPIELLFKIAGHLDAITIIRLSWVSKQHHSALGLSRSFWHRYCRLLLHDERIPLLCFDLDAFNISELIQLATRSERIARAADSGYSQSTRFARRAQFQLHHDSAFLIKQSNIHQTPGGRWVLGLASRSQDNSMHIMCWDTTRANPEALPLIPPTTCVEIKALAYTGIKMVYELHPPTYDPNLQIYSCLVSGREAFWITSISKRGIAIPIEMRDTAHQHPTFRFPDCTTTWIQDSMTHFTTSGRWAAIHYPGREPHYSSYESRSVVWDSQNGQTSDYSAGPHISEKQFDRIAVTYDGVVVRVHGEVRARTLVLHFSAPPTSSAVTLTLPKTTEVPGIPNSVPGGSNSIYSCIFAPGIIRLDEKSTATLVHIECYTKLDRFHTAVAVSPDGTLHKLPDEPWRRNEYLVPLWTSRPSTHFLLSTLADKRSIPNVFTSNHMVTLDATPLVLKCIPSALANLSSQKQVVLSVPTLPFEARLTMDGRCMGACLRSGQWMFLRAGDKQVVMFVRYD
ncbi:hypothetical protein DL93DRAFT_353315 [Clavulina sp. PMI_390]|nr:hypothetical protein DL93DRAFT_353315 [Clavulina sp. PMI_390]